MPLAPYAHRALALLAPAGRAAWSGKLRVLAYHGVPDRAAFERQVDHLVRAYTPVDLDTAIDALHGGRALPRRAVLVTFDDGERNLLENGLPVLAARGVPAVAFLVAGLIGTDEPFWWEEVDAADVPRLKQVPDRERRAAVAGARATTATRARPRRHHLDDDEVRALFAGGIAIGNHSSTHACLDRCDDAEIAREVNEAHARLTDVLGREPVAFAYPNGNEDARVVRAVRAAGYRVAFLFDHRLSDVPAPDPFRVARIRANTDDPLDRFVARVSGIHPFVHSLRGRG